jgi:hypothetical protein
MSNLEDNPKIVDEKEIQKQKIVQRIAILQQTVDMHDNNIRQFQAQIADLTTKLNQEAANFNFQRGSLNEKQLELQEFEKNN